MNTNEKRQYNRVTKWLARLTLDTPLCVYNRVAYVQMGKNGEWFSWGDELLRCPRWLDGKPVSELFWNIVPLSEIGLTWVWFSRALVRDRLCLRVAELKKEKARKDIDSRKNKAHSPPMTAKEKQAMRKATAALVTAYESGDEQAISVAFAAVAALVG